MEGEEGGGLGIRLNKDKGGEVDYKSKAGTAWSHSYLNQKPWHPLSYPNQRRKWIAEQTHANHHRRAQEVAREVKQKHLSTSDTGYQTKTCWLICFLSLCAVCSGTGILSADRSHLQERKRKGLSLSLSLSL